MTCKKCGAELKDDAKFCNECGAKVELKTPKKQFCPECGAELKPGAKFCNECGARVDFSEDIKTEPTEEPITQAVMNADDTSNLAVKVEAKKKDNDAWKNSSLLGKIMMFIALAAIVGFIISIVKTDWANAFLTVLQFFAAALAGGADMQQKEDGKKRTAIKIIFAIIAVFCVMLYFAGGSSGTTSDPSSQSAKISTSESSMSESSSNSLSDYELRKIAEKSMDGIFLGDYGSILVIADMYTTYYPADYPDNTSEIYSGCATYDGEIFNWQLTFFTPSVRSSVTNINDFKISGGTVDGTEHFVRISDSTEALTKEEIATARETGKLTSSSSFTTGGRRSASSSSSKDSSNAPVTDTSAVDPKLKAFLDEYEDFIDSYIEFMKKADMTDANTLSAYNDFMSDYYDYMEAVAAYDSDSMSTADYLYYLEVTERVNKKLLNASLN